MPLNLKIANRVRRFFPECLIHTKGEWAGRPFKLLDWQDEFAVNVFATLTPEGLRQYQTAWLEVPRKNGKTEFCAGLSLWMLVMDGEPGGEIYSAAADKEQAGIIFNMAKVMVEANEELSSMLKVYRREIVYPAIDARYKPLSSEAYTKHGLNAHGILFDEVHAQPNRELWDVLQTSRGARRQPLTIGLTTAGWDRRSLAYSYHILAERLLKGLAIDPTMFAMIFGASIGDGETPEDNWQDEKVWAKANPSLGHTVKLAFLRSEMNKALELPEYENTFKQLYLNMWTMQAKRWIAASTWEKCKSVPPELVREHCMAAVDLSSTTDLTSLVLFFPRLNYLLAWFWVPENSIRRRSKEDKVPYEVWRKDGLIEATPGDVIDYEYIRGRLNSLAELYHIDGIAIDRWNATHIAVQLDQDGFKVFPFGQGFQSMSAPCKEFERRLLGQEIHHDGNPVLSWCVANTATEKDAAGNIKPSKKVSTERIDGCVASIMAMGAWMATGNTADSGYETSGIRTIG